MAIIGNVSEVTMTFAPKDSAYYTTTAESICLNTSGSCFGSGSHTNVPVEAVAFLGAVLFFVLLLVLFFLYLNKSLCFSECGGFPCIDKIPQKDNALDSVTDGEDVAINNLQMSTPEPGNLQNNAPESNAIILSAARLPERNQTEITNRAVKMADNSFVFVNKAYYETEHFGPLRQSLFAVFNGGLSPLVRPKLHCALESSLDLTFMRECQTMNLGSLQDLQHIAADRQAWKTIISALCAIFGRRGKTN